MCYFSTSVCVLQQAIPNDCAAKALPPSQRLQIGLQALAGSETITALADGFDVSRKFVRRQSRIAEQALDEAFTSPADDDKVLFHLPVTKAWLEQLVLGLILICHSSLRGAHELVRDLFDYSLSLGTIFNIVQAAVAPAREHNQAQDLSGVRVGMHDEIFQTGQPVLVGADALSTYCYLLSLEECRDRDTWGVHLLDLQERGFNPDYVVADGGEALRAAQAEVLPQVYCRSDVFHAIKEFQEVSTILENRAYTAIATSATWERKAARRKRRGLAADRSCVTHRVQATKDQIQAITLADDVALLGQWLSQEVLGLAGPAHADRLTLFDFICAELKARKAQAPQLLGRLVTYLQGQRDDLLAFAAQLDRDFAHLAATYAVSPEQVRQFFAVHTLPLDSPTRWRRDAPLRRSLGARYFPLSQALEVVLRRTVRASSLVENLNSRLRNYFFLRRHLGNDYLTLLQFFLNHRRYLRSENPERINKSPAELLTGQSHPHWLELLGYTRFSRH